MAKFGDLETIFDTLCEGPIIELSHKYLVGTPVVSRIREIIIPEFGENLGWIRHTKEVMREKPKVESLEIYLSKEDALEAYSWKMSEKAALWYWLRGGDYFDPKNSIMGKRNPSLLSKSADIGLIEISIAQKLQWNEVGGKPDF